MRLFHTLSRLVQSTRYPGAGPAVTAWQYDCSVPSICTPFTAVM